MSKKESKHKVRLLTYAINGKGDLVHVDEVPNGNNCGCKCPACNEPLMARNKGTKRKHHFAHQSGTECEFAYETMLHRLAKEKIREAFLSKDEFWIEYEYRSYCIKKKTCTYIPYGQCCSYSKKRFNLRDFYDSCEQEKAYDNISRRSDLKIFSSTNTSLPPVFIEFCVTHASDKEKLNSGNRIIETIIEDEEDIAKIAEHGFLESNRRNGYDQDEDVYRKTLFYGFKNEDYTNNNVSEEIEFTHYQLFRSGKSRCFVDAVNCANIRKQSNTILEMIFHTPCSFGIYDFAKYIGYQRAGIANCLLCQEYVESYNGMGRICRLYKHLQIPRDCDFDTSRAKNCKYFSINEDEMERTLNNEDDVKYSLLE